MDHKQRRIVILLFILLITSSVHAQMKREMAGTDFIRLGNDNSKNSVKFDRYSIRFALPIMLKRNNTDKDARPESLLINKFEYAQTNIDYPTSDVNFTDLEQFHTISYSIGYMQKLKNNWSMMGMVSPKISSNLTSSVQWKDIRLMGMLMFTKKVKPNLDLQFGLMYSSTTGIPAPLPMFSLMWQCSEKWSVNLGFPRFQINYKLGENTEISTNLTMVGDNYTLSENLYNEGKKIDNIRIMNIGGGLMLTQKLYKMVKFNLSSGFTFYRKFEFLDEKDSIKKYDLDNDLYIKVGISIGL